MRVVRLLLHRGVRAVLVALLGVIASAALLASPASAHAQVKSSTPQPGARLDQSPESVSIRFDEKVTATAGGIRVYDATAKRIDTRSTTSAGTSMTLQLPQLADGAYVVVWQAVSADGHPVRGSFTFQVGDGDQAALAAFGEEELANASTDPVVQQLMRLLRFLLFASTALLIAAVTWRVARLPLPAGQAVRWAGIVAPIAAIGALVVDGPYGQGQGLATIGPQLFEESLSKLTVRAVLGVGLVCFLASRLLRRTDTPRAGLIGVLVLLAVLTGATAWPVPTLSVPSCRPVSMSSQHRHGRAGSFC
jgi:copper transport protein